MSQARKIYYRLCAWFPYKKLRASEEPIDVVIPVIAKDLETLPLCLEGVRKCVLNHVKQIYLVAPKMTEIEDFCKANSLVFVDETTVLDGLTPKAVNLIEQYSNGTTSDRSGWLFQQLLKLSGNVGTCKHYLCIDSDHILVRPHVFLTDDGKTVFYQSYEKHDAYYRNIHRFFPDMKLSRLSYVAHKMLFSKEKLGELHTELEKLTGKSWVRAIRDNYNEHSFADFSEFELYGNWFPEEEKVCRPWLQKTLRHSGMTDYETLCKRWRGSRMSVTFPAYRK